MYIIQHKNAKTTPAIRSLIHESHEPVDILAKRLGLSWKTVKKWKTRDSVEDVSSRPHKTRVTLTPYQEDLILFERKKYKKTVEEIYCSMETEIPGIYPMKIYRCLGRHGLSVLPKELLDAERKRSESFVNTPLAIYILMLYIRLRLTGKGGMCLPVLTAYLNWPLSGSLITKP